jgi:hypothetical protein
MPGFLGGSSAGSGGTGGEILFPKEFIDPVTKLRVSQPENLIDTDFEYGLQPTKWETVELINNTPSFFSKSGDTTIDGIQSVITNNGTREITVTTGLDHDLAVGIPINVTGTKSVTADGSYIINSIPNPRTFTYLCRDNQVGDNSIEDLYTSIITGEFFQGSQIRVAAAEGVITDGEPISTLTVKTDSTHGFGTSTPFYFLNLNSTISQEFEAANTAAKSFDSSNSATAQTFDGSNTLSSFNIDWSNSATVGGTTSIVATVSTSNNTITVSHAAETFNNLPLGTPLYYDVNTSTGFFATNPRGVVFLKTTSGLGPSQSTFQVSAIPDGDSINIEASMSGTFQIANQARTFAGNNVNPLTEITLQIEKGQDFAFDGGNQGWGGETQTNGVGTVLGYTVDNILVGTEAGAGLDWYVGAMVRYSTTGAAATGLVNNTTYFVAAFSQGSGDLYNVRLKGLPSDTSFLSPSGGSGTQTFTKIGVSVDKDIVHIRGANFAEKDMLEYTFPDGTPGRFGADVEKRFYYVQRAYDEHNYELSGELFSATTATGGTITEVFSEGRFWNVHTFTATGSSTFTVSSVGTEQFIDVLLVGGGGGGGAWGAGGGGAGGLVLRPNVAITPGSYAVTVGAGGVGSIGNAATNQATGGGNTTLVTPAGTITARGGGRGGTGRGNEFELPGAGGSGGGSSHDGQFLNPNGGAALQPTQGGISTGFGTVGGFGPGTQGWATAAGGGGAGEGDPNVPPRGTGSLGVPPAGGRGLGSVTLSGVVYDFRAMFGRVAGENAGGQMFFAGGGGAGGSGTLEGATGGRGGLGGAGRGGDSRTSVNGSSAVANTGGGGGGGSGQGATASTAGGAGGSGVVVIRYPKTPVLEENPYILATGGTTTTVTQGKAVYNVHTFSAVGASTFTVTKLGNYAQTNQIDYIIVAGGGGGGGGWNGGGGGGGGVLMGTQTAVAQQAYTFVVGGGGRGGTDSLVPQNGGNSSAFGLTAIGGGAGGSEGTSAPLQAQSGGSGGGGVHGPFAVTPGNGTTGQGFIGGIGHSSANNYVGGGGGGAGGPGVDSVSNLPGRGGLGRASTITGSLVTYGGGGGGARRDGPFALGTDGGGNGGSNGSAGANGRGGGGGAGANPGRNGAAGGSGVVIVRYQIGVVS